MGPASLRDVGLPPVRDDQSTSRDLSVSGSRARLHGFPRSGGVTRPRSLFYVALLRRGFRPGRAENQFAVGLAAQITLTTPPHGMRQRRQTEALCAYSPLRFSRHMAMGDRGLACPVNFPSASRYRRISPPVPSTTGLLTNQAYISRRAMHAGEEAFPRLSTAPTSPNVGMPDAALSYGRRRA